FYPADPNALADNVEALTSIFMWLKVKGVRKLWFRAPPTKSWFLDKVVGVTKRFVCSYPGEEYCRKHGIPKAWDVYEVQLP
ncbi:MAG: hypothetical protein ACP5JW_08120, partial [Candidatus Bathyarchaeia archaeon]